MIPSAGVIVVALLAIGAAAGALVVEAHALLAGDLHAVGGSGAAAFRVVLARRASGMVFDYDWLRL